MLFTIVEPFSPLDGEKWTSYCEWRCLTFERFDSIDGILRPSLFVSPEVSDWEHIVNENFRLHLITDLPHAKHKHEEIGKGDLVGLSHVRRRYVSRTNERFGQNFAVHGERRTT